MATNSNNRGSSSASSNASTQQENVDNSTPTQPVQSGYSPTSLMQFRGMPGEGTSPMIPTSSAYSRNTAPVYDSKGNYITYGGDADPLTGKVADTEANKQALLRTQADIDQFNDLSNVFLQHGSDQLRKSVLANEYINKWNQDQFKRGPQEAPDQFQDAKDTEEMIRMATGVGKYGQGGLNTFLRSSYNTLIGGAFVHAAQATANGIMDAVEGITGLDISGTKYSNFYQQLNETEAEAVRTRKYFEDRGVNALNYKDLVHKGTITVEEAERYRNARAISDLGLDYIQKVMDGAKGITNVTDLVDYMHGQGFTPEDAKAATSVTPWKAYTDYNNKMKGYQAQQDLIDKHINVEVNPMWSALQELDNENFLAKDAEAASATLKWNRSLDDLKNSLGDDTSGTFLPALSNAASSFVTLMDKTGGRSLLQSLENPEKLGENISGLVEYGAAGLVQSTTGLPLVSGLMATDAIAEERDAQVQAYNYIIKNTEAGLVSPQDAKRINDEGTFIGLASFANNFVTGHFATKFKPMLKDYFNNYAKSGVAYKSLLGNVGSLVWSGVKASGLVLSADVLASEQGKAAHRMTGQAYTLDEQFNDFTNATGSSLALVTTFGFIPTTKRVLKATNIGLKMAKGSFFPSQRTNIGELSVNGSMPYTPSSNVNNMYGTTVDSASHSERVNKIFTKLIPKVRGITDMFYNPYTLDNTIKHIDKNNHAESSMDAMIKLGQAWNTKLGLTSGDKVAIALGGAEHILRGVYADKQEAEEALENAKADPLTKPDLLSKLSDEVDVTTKRANNLTAGYEKVKSLSFDTKDISLPTWTKTGDRSLLGLRNEDIKNNYEKAFKLASENEDTDLSDIDLRTRPVVDEARMTEDSFSSYDEADKFMSKFDAAPHTIKLNDISKAIESNRLSKGEKIKLSKEMVSRLDGNLQNKLAKLKTSKIGRDALHSLNLVNKLRIQGKYKEADALLNKLSEDNKTNSKINADKLDKTKIIETGYERLPTTLRTRRGDTYADLKHNEDQHQTIAEIVRHLQNPDHKKVKKDLKATLNQPVRKGKVEKIANSGYNTLTRTHIKGYWDLNDTEIDHVLKLREVDHDKLDTFRRVHSMSHSPIDSNISFKRDSIIKAIKANKPINGQVLTRGEQIHLLNERHMEANAYLTRMQSARLSKKANDAINTFNPFNVDWVSAMKNIHRPKTAFKIIMGRFYREDLSAIARTVAKHVKEGTQPTTESLKTNGFSNGEIAKIQNLVKGYLATEDVKGNPIESKKGTNLIIGDMVPTVLLPAQFMRYKKESYLSSAKEIFADLLNHGEWNDQTKKYFKSEDEFRALQERMQDIANDFDYEKNELKTKQAKSEEPITPPSSSGASEPPKPETPKPEQPKSQEPETETRITEDGRVETSKPIEDTLGSAEFETSQPEDKINDISNLPKSMKPNREAKENNQIVYTMNKLGTKNGQPVPEGQGDVRHIYEYKDGEGNYHRYLTYTTTASGLLKNIDFNNVKNVHFPSNIDIPKHLLSILNNNNLGLVRNKNLLIDPKTRKNVLSDVGQKAKSAKEQQQRKEEAERARKEAIAKDKAKKEALANEPIPKDEISNMLGIAPKDLIPVDLKYPKGLLNKGKQALKQNKGKGKKGKSVTTPAVDIYNKFKDLTKLIQNVKASADRTNNGLIRHDDNELIAKRMEELQSMIDAVSPKQDEPKQDIEEPPTEPTDQPEEPKDSEDEEQTQVPPSQEPPQEPEDTEQGEEESSDEPQEPDEEPTDEDEEESKPSDQEDEEEPPVEPSDEPEPEPQQYEDEEPEDEEEPQASPTKRLIKQATNKFKRSRRKSRKERDAEYKAKLEQNKKLVAERDALPDVYKAKHINVDLSSDDVEALSTLHTRGKSTKDIIADSINAIEKFISDTMPDIRKTGIMTKELEDAIHVLSAESNSDLLNHHLFTFYFNAITLVRYFNGDRQNLTPEDARYLRNEMLGYTSILGGEFRDTYNNWFGKNIEYPLYEGVFDTLPTTMDELENLSNIGKEIVDAYDNFQSAPDSSKIVNLLSKEMPGQNLLAHFVALVPLLDNLYQANQRIKNAKTKDISDEIQQNLAVMHLLDYAARNPILFSRVDLHELLPKSKNGMGYYKEGLPIYRFISQRLISIYKDTKQRIEQKNVKNLDDHALANEELINSYNEEVLTKHILNPEQELAYEITRSKESFFDEFIPSMLTKGNIGYMPLTMTQPQYQFKDINNFRDFTTSVRGKSIFDSTAYLSMISAILSGSFDPKGTGKSKDKRAYSEILGPEKAYMHQKAKEIHNYINSLRKDEDYAKGRISSERVLQISDHLINNYAGYLYSDAIMKKLNNRVRENVGNRLLEMGARMADPSMQDRYAVAQLSREAYQHHGDPSNYSGGVRISEFPVVERLNDLGVHSDTQGLVNFYKDMQIGLENLAFRAGRKNTSEYDMARKKYEEIKEARDRGETHPEDKGGKLVEPPDARRNIPLYEAAMQGWRNILPDLQTSSQGIGKENLYNPIHMRNDKDKVAMDPKHANDLIARTTNHQTQQKILDHVFSKNPQQMSADNTLDDMNKAESARADSLLKLHRHIQEIKKGLKTATAKNASIGATGLVENIKYAIGEALHQNPLLRDKKNFEKFIGRNKGNALYRSLYEFGINKATELNERDATDPLLRTLGDNSVHRERSDIPDYGKQLKAYRDYYDAPLNSPEFYTDYEGETLYNKILSTKATQGQEFASKDDVNYIGKYFQEGGNNNIFTATKLGHDARFLGTDITDYLTNSSQAELNREVLVRSIWTKQGFKQTRALNTLSILAKQHNPRFLTSLNKVTSNMLENIKKVGIEEGTNENVVNSLIGADGKMHQHVAQILSAVGFDWMLINGFQSARPGIEAYERLVGDLNKSEFAALSDKLYGYVMPQDELVNFLGRNAMEMMNLKPRMDAPEFVEDNLANALGQIIYATMVDTKQIVFKSITPNEISDILKRTPNELKVYDDNKYSPINLVKTNDEDPMFAKLFGTEYDGFKHKVDSQAVRKLANMFDVREVETTPVKSSAQKKRSNFKNSIHTMENVNKSNEQPFKVRTATYAMFHILGDDISREIYSSGATEKDFTFSAQRESVKGQHINKFRQWSNMKDFVDDTTERTVDSRGLLTNKTIIPTYIYHSKVGWSNDRWGYALTPLNPQQDKLNRHTQAMKAWEYTIKNVGDVSKGIGEEQDMFAHKFLQLAIAEHVFDILPDKEFEDEVLKDFENRMSHIKIQEALPAFRKLAKLAEAGDFNALLHPNEYTKIADAVHHAGNNTGSFTGLYEYAKYLNNIEDNADHTFDLPRYADGINNGAYITMQQAFFGEHHKYNQNITKLSSFGVSHDEGYTYAGNIKQNPLADNYKNFGHHWGTFLKEIIGSITDPDKLDKFNKIESFIGDLSSSDGRESAKYSFLKMIYSAGPSTIIRDLAGEQLDKVYDKIAKRVQHLSSTYVGTNEDDAKAAALEIATIINNFMDIVGGEHVEVIPTSTQRSLTSFKFYTKGSHSSTGYSLKNLDLYRHSKAFEDAVADIYETPLRKTMTSEYSNFSEYKDNLNSVNTIMGSSYNAMYKSGEEQLLKKAKIQGRNYLTVGERNHLENKLKPHLPAIYSPESVFQGLLYIQKSLAKYSKELEKSVSANKITATESKTMLNEYKTKLAKSYMKSLNNCKIEFNRFQPVMTPNPDKNQITTLNFSKPIRDANGNTLNSITNTAYKRQLVVGAGAVALSTHALEAAVAMAMTAVNPGVNVHDGTGFGVNHYKNAPKDVSKALYEVNGIFDTMTQFSNSMENTLHEMFKDPNAVKYFRNELDEGYQSVLRERQALERQELNYLSMGDGDSDGDDASDSSNIQDPDTTTSVAPVNLDKLSKPKDALFKSIVKLSGDTQFKSSKYAEFKGIDTTTGKAISDEDFKKNLITNLRVFNLTARQVAHYKNESLNALKVYDAYSNGAESAYKIDDAAIKRVDDLRELRKEIDSINHLSTDFDTSRIQDKRERPSFVSANNKFLGSSEEALNTFAKTTFKEGEKIFLDSRLTHKDLASKYSELLQSTAGISESHADHLHKIVKLISDNVIDPIELYLGQGAGANALGRTDTGKVIILKEDPIQASRLTRTNSMTTPEVYVHELIHRLSQEAIERDGYLRSQLTNLWELSKANIKPEDMLPEGLEKTDPTYKEELKYATANWNHIFQVRQGKLDHLHEFMAFINSNEKFKQLNDKIKVNSIFNIKSKDRTKDAKDKLNLVKKDDDGKSELSVRGSAISLLVKIFEFVRDLFKKVSGDDVSTRAESLLAYAGRIDQKIRQEQLNAKNGEHHWRDIGKYVTGNNGVKDVGDKAKGPWGKGIKYAEEKIEKTYNSILKSNNIVAKNISGVLSEMRGRTTYNTKIMDIKNKMNSEVFGEAVRTSQNIADDISSKFKDGITPEQDSALKSVLLKSNFHNLDDLAKAINVPLDKESLIINPIARDVLIKDIENKLKGTNINDKDYKSNMIPSLSKNEHTRILAHSYNLGRFMATGNSMLINAMLSTKLINDHELNLLSDNNTRRDILDSEGYENREAMIKGLVTLHALDFTAHDDLNNFHEMYTKNDDNKYAIDYASNYVRDHVQKQQLEYQSRIYELHDGYTNDVNKTKASTVIIDPTNAEDLSYYMARGYVKVEDISATDHPAIVMVNHLGDTGPYVHGAIKFDPKRKPITSTLNLGDNVKERQKAFAEFGNIERFQLQNPDKTYKSYNTYSAPIPIRDGNSGDIIGYRYTLNHALKDKILGTDRSFIRTFSKQVTSLPMDRLQREANGLILDALREVQDNELHKDKDLFVNIGPNSSDKEIKKLWDNLSTELKDMIKVRFGSNGLNVRKDTVNMLFGYHQADIRAKIFVPPEQRNVVVKFLIDTFASFCNGDQTKAINFIVRSNDFWKELMAWAKNAIVIKSGRVTLLNLVGNWHQLVISGLGPVKAFTYMMQAYSDLKEYDKIKADLQKAKILEASPHLRRASDGFIDTSENLQNRLEQTQIHRMSKLGIDPTETEDDTHDMKYTELGKLKDLITGSELYKSSIKDFVGSDQLQWVKSNILTARGTQGYKEMQRKAEFAEFGAKYARFKFLTEEMKFADDKAARHVVDEFIDYDIPQSKMLNALDSYGLLWFTKYKLRLQKTLWNMFKRNPARVVSAYTLNSAFKSVFGGTILEHTESPYEENTFTNSIFHNIHNPFTMLGHGITNSAPLLTIANSFLRS